MGWATEVKSIRNNLLSYIQVTAPSFDATNFINGFGHFDSYPWGYIKFLSCTQDPEIRGHSLMEYWFRFVIVVRTENTGVPSTDEDTAMDAVGEVVDVLQDYAEGVAGGAGDWERLDIESIDMTWKPGTPTLGFTETSIYINIRATF